MSIYVGEGRSARVQVITAVVLCVVVLLGCVASSGCGGRDPQGPPLVVYCAHEARYAGPVLARFEERAEIPLVVKYGQQLPGSESLVDQVIRERENPQCDVLWNNQLLSTLELQQRGLLEPHIGAGWRRIPDEFKDVEGYYTGFAARFRVWMYNTNAPRRYDTQEDIRFRLEEPTLGTVAIDAPSQGTAMSHYTVLWDLWGPRRLKRWHEDWRERGVMVRQSGESVRNVVIASRCDLGMTDSDYALSAIEEGKPIGLTPYRLPTEQTICIPNTVAIVQGTKQPERAARLVEYLLSQATEIALANSAGGQVPLGPVDNAEAVLPAEVLKLRALVAESYPLKRLGPVREKVAAWMDMLASQEQATGESGVEELMESQLDLDR